MFIRKGSCEKSDSASNENLPSMFESHMDGQMFSDSITEVLGAQWPIGEASFLLAEGKPAFLQQCFFQDFYHTGGPSYICVYIYTLTYPTVYTGKSYYFRVWGWNIHWDFGWTIFFVETMLKIHPFHPSRIPQTCWTYGWWDLEIARGDVPLRVRCFFFLTSSMATRMDLRHPGFCIYF